MKKIIAIVSIVISFFVIGIIAIPIIVIIDKLEINGTITLPDWLVTPVAILFVGSVIGLASPINKFINKKYKK